jgi:hypothetical protein
MNHRMPRLGWIGLLLSAACGSGGPQTIWTSPAPAASDPQPNGSSGAASASGSSSSSGGATVGGSGGSSGAPNTASLDTGGGNPPATASGIAGSVDGGVAAGGGGSSGSSGGTSPAGAATPDAFVGAPAYVSQVGSSAHNPGTACTKSGCHGPGGGETPFIIGGTVYKDYKGTIPAPGVEIRVKDMAGHAASVYSGTNGNFYITTNAGGVTLPAVVAARDGTTVRPMITPLTVAGFGVGVGTMGACASVGCHITGGTDGGPVSGAYYPIHVP